MKNSKFKFISLILSLILLSGSVLVHAETDYETFEETNPEYTQMMQENIEEVISDIFSSTEIEDNSTDSGITPRWGGAAHEDSVDTSYGNGLTLLMREMCTVPDDNQDAPVYTMSSSRGKGNCMNTDLIVLALPLSDGTGFSILDTTTTLRDNSILHGRGNYLASLRFLYTVAKNLVTEEYHGPNYLKIHFAVRDSLDSTDIVNGTFYGENVTYAMPDIDWEDEVLSRSENSADQTAAKNNDITRYMKSINAYKPFTSLEQRVYLEKVIYIIANTRFQYENAAYNSVVGYDNVNADNEFEVKTALKLIGIATHLCGDIYAHKTVVPWNTTFVATKTPENRAGNTIYRGGTNKGIDFYGRGRWSKAHGIKTLVQAQSTITTQQITQWQIARTTKYPDSKNFYNKRWSVGTKQLVANMYDNFFDGSTLGNMGFYVNWFLYEKSEDENEEDLRLANLKVYAYSIGSQPTMDSRLTRLGELDSAVAMSDVVPTGGYTLPGDSVNTWRKGYTPSC